MGVFYVEGDMPLFVIGRDPACDLVLAGSFVSRKHLVLRRIRPDVAAVEVLGTNGAVIDKKQVNKGYKGYVGFGDSIVIGDQRIVWIGSLKSRGCDFIRGLARPKLADISPVEIEGPPPRKVPEKPSVMTAAGPALTMAIPILLGVGRSVAILSSVFAALWAVINVLSRVRKQKTEEIRRQRTYTAYLEECEEAIRERLKNIIRSMNRIYPQVSDMLKEGADPGIIWNDEPDDDKGIRLRIGCGTCDSPLEIAVPKERFAVIDDSLKLLPGKLKEKYKTIPSSPYLLTLPGRSVSTFILSEPKDYEMLSAFILQAAGRYSPDILRIVINVNTAIMRSLSWAQYLPHCCRGEENDCSEDKKTLVITDSKAYAYSSIGGGSIAVLIRESGEDVPAGVGEVINRKKRGIIIDRIPEKLCRSFAAQLSAMSSSDGNTAAIPKSVSLGELLSDRTASLTGEKLTRIIAKNYEKFDVTVSIGAPIGRSSQGKVTVLDIHEKASGPHGLIAGTTGSGKSELLTTVILSYAARFPPDKLSFFLIDYKGGGMSNLFSDLPHLAGAVSNLSAAESRRAMIALRSENLKRQRIFAECGVNNINDYTRLYDAGKVIRALPHVVIIVDEFAELRREEPEFMDSLISVSQTGRSLGMHLILATQKPAGVIDDRIRGNSRFRIALRLVDAADSADMIGTKDAAEIRECGRAILQAGNNEIYEEFMSAYAMAKVNSARGSILIFEDVLFEKEIGLNNTPETFADGSEKTWYDLTMEAVRDACSARKVQRCEPLWLPPLPEEIRDDEAFALFDDPYMQRYEKVVYDPEKTGHMLVIGRSGSGKSTLLMTVLQRITQECAVYIADPGGGRLRELSGQPFCGGYVSDDAENTERMLMFVNDELNHRRKRSAGHSPPWVLVLDDLDEIRKACDTEASEWISNILAFGAKEGVFVLASSRTMGTGLAAHFDTILFLGENDPFNVSAALKVAARDVPKIRDDPGRGIGLLDGRVLEFQTVNGKCRMAKSSRAEYPAGPEIQRYPYVPAEPSFDDLIKRAVIENPPDRSSSGVMMDIPVGFERKSGRIYLLPTGSVNCILVCGRPYTGKHTFLSQIPRICEMYGVGCIKASSYADLLTLADDTISRKIVIIESISKIMEQFYESDHDRQTETKLASFFENPAGHFEKLNNSPVLIGIMDNGSRTKFSGRKIMDSIMTRPYGINFGGHLDENRILDFTYLPFSIMQREQKCHNATILKFDENHYFGPVIFPSAK